jgi:hypothetical protein
MEQIIPEMVVAVEQVEEELLEVEEVMVVRETMAALEAIQVLTMLLEAQRTMVQDRLQGEPEMLCTNQEWLKEQTLVVQEEMVWQ